MGVSMSTSSQWQLLQNAYRQNRLSHAYLLSGMRDIGKTDFARDFATFLLCEKKSSCGQCRSCILMRAQTHPDFLLIAPHEKNHSIKIDQIRALGDALSRTALHCGYQIVLISPADAMPLAAANALLKTLEEPHGHIIFFLIDHQEHVLPATILSRCQKLYFHAPEKITSFIEKEHAKLEDDLIKHLEDISRRKKNAIALAPSWQKNMTIVLRLLLLIAVDISRIQHHVNEAYCISSSHVKKLIPIAQTIDVIALQKWMRCILEKLSFYTQGINLNAQLCLEDIFIAWEALC